MKIFNQLTLAVLCCVLISCGGSNNADSLLGLSSESRSEQSPVMSKEASSTEVTPASQPRKLIKTGDMSFETSDLDSSREKIDVSVKKHQAFISSESENTSGRRISRNLTIRVPAENFDQLVNEISQGIKAFDHKNISSNDVTEEFLDVEARLKNRKALEERYLELLSKASTTADILQIENQINQLRGEIESIEGRMKYLSNQVDYSTLNLSYYKTTPVQSHLTEKMSQGFKNGWSAVIYVFIILANLWPFILLVAIILMIVWYFNRRKNRKFQQ
jgi:hypothetical protein